MAGTLLDVVNDVIESWTLVYCTLDDQERAQFAEELVEAIAYWLVAPRNGETEVDNT